tara:strand:+ start:14757 stop:15128 length:372 start_codon:yes stop_codon:yes gene_type:complete
MPRTNQCANFYCDNIPFGNRIRCANCRRSDINTCCDCDEPTTRRAVLCNDCRLNHIEAAYEKIRPRKVRVPKALVYPKPYPNCLMCEKQLSMRGLKVCQGGDCIRIYSNLNQIVTRGRKYITN